MTTHHFFFSGLEFYKVYPRSKHITKVKPWQSMDKETGYFLYNPLHRTIVTTNQDGISDAEDGNLRGGCLPIPPPPNTSVCIRAYHIKNNMPEVPFGGSSCIKLLKLDLGDGAGSSSLPPAPTRPSDMSLIELYDILYLVILSPSQKKIHLWAVHHNQDRKKHLGTSSQSQNRPPNFSLNAELLQEAGPCKVTALDNILCLHLLKLQVSILYDLEAKIDGHVVPPIQISSACVVAESASSPKSPINGRRVTDEDVSMFDALSEPKAAEPSHSTQPCETTVAGHDNSSNENGGRDGLAATAMDWTVDVVKLKTMSTTDRSTGGSIGMVCEIVRTKEYDTKWKWIADDCIWDHTVQDGCDKDGRTSNIGILWKMKLDVKTCIYVIMNSSGNTKSSYREAALFALRRSESHFPNIPAILQAGQTVARLPFQVPQDKLRPKAILLYMIEACLQDEKVGGIRSMFEAINKIYAQALGQTVMAVQQHKNAGCVDNLGTLPQALAASEDGLPFLRHQSLETIVRHRSNDAILHRTFTFQQKPGMSKMEHRIDRMLAGNSTGGSGTGLDSSGGMLSLEFSLNLEKPFNNLSLERVRDTLRSDDMDSELEPSSPLPSYLLPKPAIVLPLPRAQLQRSFTSGPPSSLLWDSPHTVVLQWEIFTRVFLPACQKCDSWSPPLQKPGTNSTGASPFKLTYIAGVLLEYIKSLYLYNIKIETYLVEFWVEIMGSEGLRGDTDRELFEVSQFLQMNIAGDSASLAQKILELSFQAQFVEAEAHKNTDRCHRRGRRFFSAGKALQQLAVDMLFRLKQYHLIFNVLFEDAKLVTAMSLICDNPNIILNDPRRDSDYSDECQTFGHGQSTEPGGFPLETATPFKTPAQFFLTATDLAERYLEEIQKASSSSRDAGEGGASTGKMTLSITSMFNTLYSFLVEWNPDCVDCTPPKTMSSLSEEIKEFPDVLFTDAMADHFRGLFGWPARASKMDGRLRMPSHLWASATVDTGEDI
jgi:hypothetical protein